MAGVSAILALITRGIEEELAAESTQDDLIKLLLDELVSVHLVYLSFALTNSSLTTETARIEGPLANILLHYTDGELP